MRTPNPTSTSSQSAITGNMPSTKLQNVPLSDTDRPTLSIYNNNSITNNKNKTYNQTLSYPPTQHSSSKVSCYTRRRKHARNSHGSFKKIHGDPLGQKQSSTVRLVFENFNGLAAWKPRNEKILLARKFLQRLSADCYIGVECNVQWTLL